jgi:hypothetical protein
MAKPAGLGGPVGLAGLDEEADHSHLVHVQQHRLGLTGVYGLPSSCYNTTAGASTSPIEMVS